jgi:hypothetical protein
MKKYSMASVADLIGNPQEYSLEHRIFNSMMLVVSITGVIVTIYNIVLHIPFVQSIMTTSFILVAASSYVFSMKKKEYEKLVLPISIYFFLLMAISWFVTYGSQGSVAFYFFVFVPFSAVYFSKNIKLFLFSVILYISLLLLCEYLFPDYLIKYETAFQQFIDVGLSLILCLIVNILIIYYIYKEYVQERDMKDSLLKQALLDKDEIEKMFKEIKILKGIIPICASCKKIRDKKGNWNHIEEYLDIHSEAKLTHGICPDCVAQLYPELNIKLH